MTAIPVAANGAAPTPPPQKKPNYTPPESPPESIEWDDSGLPYRGRRAAQRRWSERSA